MDVNTKFDTDRAAQFEAAQERQNKFEAQVASGEMVPVQGKPGFYRSTQGWDKGEVWNLNARGLLLPQHGLDMSTGKAALYTRQPEWHNVGTVIPAGLTEITLVLQAGGIAFQVKQAPSMYQVGGELFTAPETFTNYRDDTNGYLGTVTGKYTVFQNERGAQFLQDLCETYDCIFETAGALKGGRRVFITIKLPETVEIDPGGIADPYDMYLAWVNNHDGNGKAETLLTPWRIRCGNTDRFASRDAVTRWGTRHVGDGMSRLAEARRQMGLTLKSAKVFADETTALARTPMSNDAFDKLLAELWPAEKLAEGQEESVRSRNYRERRTTALWERFGTEAAAVGKTAYAAREAVTGYCDHVQPRRVTGDKLAAAKATAIVEGYDDDTKSKAHRKLLTLVRH